MSIIIVVKEQNGNPIVFYDTLTADSVAVRKDIVHAKAWWLTDDIILGFAGQARLSQSLYLATRSDTIEWSAHADGDGEATDDKSPDEGEPPETVSDELALVFALQVSTHVEKQGFASDKRDDEDCGYSLILAGKNMPIYLIEDGFTEHSFDEHFAAIGAPRDFVLGALATSLDRTDFDTVCASVRPILKQVLSRYVCVREPIMLVSADLNNGQPYPFMP